MALADEFQARYSSSYVINLTNPDLPSASSVDSTRLAGAAADAIGMFNTYVGVTYDNDDAQHLDVALELVDYKLRVYVRGPSEATRTEERNLIGKLRALGKQKARHQVQPQTSSNLDPVEEQAGARPVFDRANLGGLLIRPPSTGSSLRDRNFN